MKLWKIGASVLGVAAVGVGAWTLYERLSEQPPFDVIASDGAFSLRRYGPMLVAQTSVPVNDREEALNRGFGTLARYIFAKDRPGPKIAMTAPVLSDRSEEGRWRTRFVMPRRFTRDTLPPGPPDVIISEVPARTMAVVRFSGGTGDDVLAEKEAALRRWIARQERQPSGPVEYGFYNSPFVPGPLRRNEVLIPVS